MTLRIVGSSTAMPRPGRACSAYLVEGGDAAVLLDIGTGSVAKLQLVTEYTRLDAIVVSHMHADHFFDLVPLRQGLKYGPLACAERLPVFLPPGGGRALDVLRQAVSPDASADFFDAVYDVREYDPTVTLAIEELQLTFAPTQHYIEGFAVRVECEGRSITYSSDTAPCDTVVELARETGLLLAEASLGLAGEEGKRGHSSAEEAGEMACRAAARRLVLTHYGSAYSGEALIGAAKRHFAGRIDAADDGLQFSVFGSPRGSEN
ncbi:MAG: MBL fold metallo-hydrolase [Candidatus Cybelea sp.]